MNPNTQQSDNNELPDKKFKRLLLEGHNLGFNPDESRARARQILGYKLSDTDKLLSERRQAKSRKEGIQELEFILNTKTENYIHAEALKEVPESKINISAEDLTKLLMKTLPVELVPNKEKMEELTARPGTITDNLTNYLLNTPAVKNMGDKGPAFVDSAVNEIAEKLAA